MTPWRQPSRYCGPCVALSLRSLILPTRGREPATSEEARSRPQAGRRRGGVVGGRHRKQVHGNAVRERRLNGQGRAATVGEVVVDAAATGRGENGPLPRTRPRNDCEDCHLRGRVRADLLRGCRHGQGAGRAQSTSADKAMRWRWGPSSPRKSRGRLWVTSSRTRLPGGSGSGGGATTD